MKKNGLIAAAAILSTVLCCIISHSCANTSQAPTGGPKDTIPPVLLNVTPPRGDTAFPLVGGAIYLRFDEYTVAKDAQGILLSPPTKKKPKVKMKGKDLVVTFPDTLQPNTTYTIDFGEALADNNESNKAPRYIHVFSTGSEVDSMYICGTVVDCENLTPIKNAIVSLYTDMSDSACMNLLPVAATRTDDWGFFAIRNVKPIEYRIYATTDENKDYKYNLGEEKIGFWSDLIVPHMVVNDSIYELQTFDMKDTLECLARKGEIEIAVFKEFYSKQFIKDKGRKAEKTGYVTFGAPNVEISSFQILGVDSSDIIMQYSPQRDSFDFWINADYQLSDSLLLTLKYMKTDSTGNLALTKEDIAIAMPKDQIAKAKTPEGKQRAAADTITDLKIELTDTNVEQDGIAFVFSSPVIEMHLDSILLLSTNTRNQTDTSTFTFLQDSTNIMRYVLQSEEPYQAGYKYELKIAEGTFFDVYHRKNKKAGKEFQLPNTEKLCVFTANVTGTQGKRYIVELVDESCKKSFRKYVINSDQTLLFPYLQEGRYAVRVTEDRNGNGLFDTGNLMKWQQAEPTRLYKLPDGSKSFEMKEQMDLTQDINLIEIFQ